MIKRAVNEQFRAAVMEGRKVSTIRSKAWPVGVPIMLFSWAGVPYRSEHVDLCAVMVLSVEGIGIEHGDNGGVKYSYARRVGEPRLCDMEGFGAWAEMDAWFRRVVKAGTCERLWLMRFAKFEEGAE